MTPKEKALAYQKMWRKNNSEKANAYQKMWRKNNSEKANAYWKEWCKKNPDKVREYHKKWRKRNPDKVKENRDRWRKKNPEKANESVRQWRKRNPEKVRENLAKFAASKLWIPVTQSLPPPNEAVLVHCANADEFGSWVGAGFYLPEGWQSQDSINLSLPMAFPVTHWQPLPLPPKDT